jgi:hypothetical protein
METQWWIVLVVVVISGAVIAYRRFSGTRSGGEQARQMSVQTQNRARSPDAVISQREDRRLAGMTADDRAWEQASLQRNRESQERTRQARVSAESEAHR